MPADPPPALPGAVLFACNFNRVRSAMAENLMKLMYGTQVYVDSCGLRQDEEAEPDPFAVAVMEEVGADMSRHRPKTFDDLEDGSFDLVVSLTPEAQHRAVELARHHAVDIEYWPTQDPTLTLGSRDAVLEAYRETRDALATRIRGRFGKAAYAAEELIAELGAAFLAAEFGFDGDVRHAGYIATWITLLRSDKRALFTAASKAQGAADYLRGLALAEPEEEQEAA